MGKGMRYNGTHWTQRAENKERMHAARIAGAATARMRREAKRIMREAAVSNDMPTMASPGAHVAEEQRRAKTMATAMAEAVEERKLHHKTKKHNRLVELALRGAKAELEDIEAKRQELVIFIQSQEMGDGND